ncbi:MAG: radical SAM protein [bacterium]
MDKLKVLFILNKMGTMEPFSVPILSALAKNQGHDVKLIIADKNKRQLLKKASLYKPDIIAYSVCSNEAEEYLKINQILKDKLKFFSLFGGPHPTFFPSFIRKKDIDSICIGEADISFVEFLNSFRNDNRYKTYNFSFKKSNKIIENPLNDLLPDLDRLPFPDRDIIYSQSYFLAQNPVKTFMTGRGCPFNCSYCFNHILNKMYRSKGKIIRLKSVSYLIEEINEVREKYPLKFIKFHDDIFGSNRSWLAEFADKYPREVGLPFLCLSRPNMLTQEYCRLLKRSGCNSVEIGVECGNEQIRNNILNRNVKNKHISDGCGYLKQFGINIYTLNMVGLPGETFDDMLSTIKINQRNGVDFTDTSIFQPYPGTQLTDYCMSNGYLKKGIENFQSQFSFSILNFNDELKNRIYTLHRLFAILVDYPKMVRILPFLFWINRFSFIRYSYNLIYRFYYGYNLHKRIYASKIPLLLRFYGGFITVFSKNRV